MSTRSKPILEIIERLAGLDVDEGAKNQFTRLVFEIGAAHGIAGLDRNDRITFAGRLLQAKVSKPTIRDRLMARYEISKTQAYRVIQHALDQNRRKNGPRKSEYVGNEIPSGEWHDNRSL